MSFERSDGLLSLGQSLGTCIFEAPTGQLSLETAEAALVAFLSPVFHLDRGLHHPEAEYALKGWAWPASNSIDSAQLYLNWIFNSCR